jgi:serine phosphatase RsbU (regulator of sigma subunit)
MSILGVRWWVHVLRAIVCGAALWVVTEAGSHIPDVRPATVAMTGVLVTLFFAIRWGPISAVVGALSSGLAFDYYLLTPPHTFGFEDVEGVVAAFAVVVTSCAVSYVSLLSERNAKEADRRRLEAERLNQLGDALLPSASSKAVGNTVVEKLITHFGAKGAALELADGEVFRAGSVVLPEKLAEQAAGLGSEVVLPVAIGKETVARLAIGFAKDGGSISPSALDAISHQLSMVLGRVRASEQLARFAADIQMGMLPNTFPAFPQQPEVDLFATLIPAQDVGGDFYDYFALPDGRVCFIIGDVSDKGVPAALFMAMVVTAFQILATKPRATAAQMMTDLNDYVCENNRSQMFVTALAGIFDPQSGNVEYCDAGHEPPFMVRASGRVELVEKVGGIALGIMPDHIFISGSLRLDAGDTLVTYTDGVNEAMNPERQLFTTPAIGEVLCHLARNADAKDTCETLMQRVQAFAAGAPQSDDITMLALRYRGARAAAPVSSAQAAT